MNISGIPRTFSSRARRTREPPISWLMRRPLEVPETITLAAGFVDQESLPWEEVRNLCEDVLSRPQTALSALQYGSTIGLGPLREQILARLERDGITADGHKLSPENVVVTNGSQQLLYLATHVLVDPGDIVLVEDPTYFVYLGILDEAGANPVGVPTDREGIIPEALDYVLTELHRLGVAERVKILYLMTYYGNPTGRCLSPLRREAILKVLGEFQKMYHRIFVIEDAAYRDLALEGPPPRPLKELDTKNAGVVYAGTFSKPFAPGLRLGFGVLPEKIMTCVLRQKGNQDFGSSNFSQHLVLRALETGAYDRQVDRLAQVYRAKRDAFLADMKTFLPGDCDWDPPAGGLYCWVQLKGIDTGPNGPLFQAALDRNVIYVPGAYCYCEEPGVAKDNSSLRLCYGLPASNILREGLSRLGEAIRACRAG